MRSQSGRFHSRPQRPRSFWSAPITATSGQVHRKSAIHGLPVILRRLRVKSDKSDWFWSPIVMTKPVKTGMSLDLAKRSRFLVLTKRSAASGDENAWGGKRKRRARETRDGRISKRARSSRAHFDFLPFLRPVARPDPLSPTVLGGEDNKTVKSLLSGQSHRHS